MHPARATDADSAPFIPYGHAMLTPNFPPPPYAGSAVTHDYRQHRPSISADVVVGEAKFRLNDLKLPITFEQLSTRIVARGSTTVACPYLLLTSRPRWCRAGYPAPWILICKPGELKLEVTDGPFAARFSNTFVSSDQPFVHYYYKVYLPAVRGDVAERSAGDPPPYVSESRVKRAQTMIEVGEVNIQLQRTIRVPGKN